MALASRKILHLLIIMVAAVCLTASNANASKRVALVIGNSDYQNAANLPNPTNDADAMTRMLKNIGFEVSKLKDVGYNQMRLALRKFASKAVTADIALIFYAGHGMEVNKHNYLIPSDATLVSDRDIDFETVPLDLVTQAAGGARKLSLVLLDACRNNPFAASMKRTSASRSIGRGLAKVEPTTGTLISFAAKEGTVAADGNGKNSPYTVALMNHLQRPGLEINILFRKVRDAVLQDTGGNQEPFTYSSLPGNQIYLVEPESSKNIQAATKPEIFSSAIQRNKSTEDEARIVYNDIKNSGDITILEIFAGQFPNSIYAKFARGKIEALKGKNRNAAKVVSLNTSSKAFRKSDKLLNKCDRFAASITDEDNRTGLTTGYVQIRKNSDKAVTACELASSNYPEDRQTLFQLGRSHDAARNYADAAKYYTLAMKKGNLIATGHLASLFEYGHGVSKNYEEAARLRKIAADKGDVGSIYSLASFFRNGKGVPQNYKEAARLYKLADSKYHRIASHELALLYRNGQGVSPNNKEAAALMFRALHRKYDRSVKEMTSNSDGWSKHFRQELQRKMKQEGYYNGEIDGNFGSATITAIKKVAGQ